MIFLCVSHEKLIGIKIQIMCRVFLVINKRTNRDENISIYILVQMQTFRKINFHHHWKHIKIIVNKVFLEYSIIITLFQVSHSSPSIQTITTGERYSLMVYSLNHQSEREWNLLYIVLYVYNTEDASRNA